MLWSDIRSAYPDQWLIVEALEAHSTSDKRRHLDRLAVLEKCPDGSAAMQRYRELHRQYPQREFYFVHTSREQLDIREYEWLGIRRGHEIDYIQVGKCRLQDVEIEVGGMDYGFGINGVLGMDFLIPTGCIINLRKMELKFSN